MPEDSNYPLALKRLVQFLRRLPGIGNRTAERLAFALLDWSDEDLDSFGSSIAQLRKQIQFCEICGNLADEKICRICRSSTRDQNTICVVENSAQITAIEKSGAYRGLYHVLGGRIVPLEDKGPDELRIEELRRRLESGTVKEMILATGSDVEGEATANYLATEFKSFPVNITRIAAGIPVGADLSFADSATMAIAMSGRRQLRTE